MSHKFSFFAILLLAAVIVLPGCDSNSESTSMFKVYLTDMPFPFDDADSANVVIERVELIGSADSTESIILVDTARAFNLLDLRNGVVAELAEIDVPLDEYAQLRMIVGEDASVVLNDGRVFDLKVPSGSQTGIKINLPDVDFLSVTDSSVVTVDFNVEESFVVKGNPTTVAGINGFNFKPVLKIAELSIDGVPVDLSDSDE